MKKILIVLTIFLMGLINVNAKEIDIHLFYQESCPHCHKEKVYLEELKNENKDINVFYYELGDPQNGELFTGIQKLLDKPSNYVPYTVIGEHVLTSFDETNGPNNIKRIIELYEEKEYRNIVEEYKNNKDLVLNIEDQEVLLDESEEIELSVLGKVNPKKVSLLLLSVVVGFVDGFNPCAMWILLFLISMLIGMKDKKKMWILGITFIATSAIVYMFFMLAWLNVAIFVTKISYIRLLIGIFAILFGMYNITKVFKKSKDGCEVIDDKKRTTIIDKIKDITSNKKFILAILGIMLLSVSVNLVELLCSAGLPLAFTNILAMNELSGARHFMYIAIYIFFFMLDDLIIFIIAMVTLKVTGISTKYTKYSNLIGGIIILLIGLAMIFAPELLTFSI